jgi:hypothetical protein
MQGRRAARAHALLPYPTRISAPPVVGIIQKRVLPAQRITYSFVADGRTLDSRTRLTPAIFARSITTSIESGISHTLVNIRPCASDPYTLLSVIGLLLLLKKSLLLVVGSALLIILHAITE